MKQRKQYNATPKRLLAQKKMADYFLRITVKRERTPYEMAVEKLAIRSTWSRAKRFAIERKEGKAIQTNQVEDLEYLRNQSDELSPEDRGRLSSKPSRMEKIRIDPQDMTLFCSHIVEEVMAVADADFDGDELDWHPSEAVAGLTRRWIERHGDLGDIKEIIWDSSMVSVE